MPFYFLYIHQTKKSDLEMQQIVFKGLAGLGLVLKGLVFRFALIWHGLSWANLKTRPFKSMPSSAGQPDP